MLAKIIEAVDHEDPTKAMHWGKFLVGVYDVPERIYNSKVPGCEHARPVNLMGDGGRHFWLLDLATGEGARFSFPESFGWAQLDKHQIHVCLLFEPFLDWLFGHINTTQHSWFEQLPPYVTIPAAKTGTVAWRRPGLLWHVERAHTSACLIDAMHWAFDVRRAGCVEDARVIALTGMHDGSYPCQCVRDGTEPAAMYLDRAGKAIGLLRWAHLRENAEYSTLIYTETPRGDISTKWLGSFSRLGGELPYGTAYFPTPGDAGTTPIELRQYLTEDEARQGHQLILDWLTTNPTEITDVTVAALFAEEL